MIDNHFKLKKKILHAPIEQLDTQGHKLLRRIIGNQGDADSGFSGMLKCVTFSTVDTILSLSPLKIYV